LWDTHHLDISTLYKSAFFDPAPGKGPPNRTTAEACRTLAEWNWPHAALLSTRLMGPTAPPVLEEVEVSDSFATAPATHVRGMPPPYTCPQPGTERANADPIGAVCCRASAASGKTWRPGGREIGPLHATNASIVAILIKILANVLITLFGATIATQLSRKPSAK
jgi:hypothetical protein